VIDSYLLHGPTQGAGLAAADWEAWRAMEPIRQSGRTRLRGVSNVNLEQLRQSCDRARVRPRFVQNRCYAAQGGDRLVRQLCADNGLVYQGFSLLTANCEILTDSEMVEIAKHHRRSVAQVVFPFALDAGMAALTGTTDAEHIQPD
jgi:diketogulonate reductase-like aldo/keto reductase